MQAQLPSVEEAVLKHHQYEPTDSSDPTTLGTGRAGPHLRRVPNWDKQTKFPQRKDTEISGQRQ